MAILVNGVKVAGAGVPGQNATINGVNALTIEALAPLLAQMSGSTLTLSLDGGAGAQVETGSYVGTGTYGASNPTSYTFQFPVKAVFIYGVGVNFKLGGWLIVSSNTGFYHNFNSNAANPLVVSHTGNTVSWYYNGGTSGWTQFNNSGDTYYVIGLS